MNKVFIGLIAFLIVVSGGLGYWSSNLSGRISTLNDDTQAFKADTTGQFNTVNSDISSVDSRLTSFKTETADKFSDVQNDITGLDTNLSSFKTSTASQFNVVQSSIAGINTNVAGLDTDLASISAQYSESTMNVRRVYEDVINSVCMITDGTNTLGSGFVYSATGHVITAAHVINDQARIDVVMHDGTCASVTVIGSDDFSDVAVLKMEGISNLQPLTLADSGVLVVGEPVIVVGNPLGIFESVTYGVISRLRGIGSPSGISWSVTNLIQYDAPSTGGNSGGPVFNKEGQVIGIVSFGYSSFDISYAISSNKIKRVAQAIINQGSYTNATLPGDWWISDLTPEDVISMGLDSSFGVIFDSAINVGEVLTNDVVIAVDGIAIKDAAELFSYIGEFKSVGDTLTLAVIRNGMEIEADVVLEEGWIQ